MKRAGDILSKTMILLIAIGLFASFCVRFGFAFYHNYDVLYINLYGPPDIHRFSERFGEFGGAAQLNSYQAKKPLHADGFIDNYFFPGGSPGFGTDLETIDRHTVTLSRPIRYYEMIYGKYVVAFEIPEGTEIYASGTTARYPESPGYGGFAYGTNSLPTYERGWRYAVPFMIVTENLDVPVSIDFLVRYNRATGYYYVKLEDLRAVFKDLYESNPGMIEEKEKWRISYKAYEAEWLLPTDRIMFYQGYYLSPDGYHPYFDTLNIALLSSSGALLAAYICARVYKRQKRKDG